MNTTILLIRHGQTEWNLTYRWQGHLDIPLNEIGRRQSNLLAHRLASWPIGAVYSSDLQRASETAAILGRVTGHTPILDERLRERHGGTFQGLSVSKIQAEQSAVWQQISVGGQAPPGGETAVAVAERALAAYQAILAECRGKMVAIVTHGGTLRLLIGQLLGLPSGKPAPIQVGENTCLSIIEESQTGPRLVRLNDICHLESADDPGLLRSSTAKYTY